MTNNSDDFFSDIPRTTHYDVPDDTFFGSLSPLAILSNVIDMLDTSPLLERSPTMLRRLMQAEPPYARLVRRLGLYELPELPQEPRHTLLEPVPKQSTFPVVAHSSRHNNEYQQGSRVMAHVNEALGESARWAVGNIFGHLRESMDRIEDRVNREAEQRRETGREGSLYGVLREDVVDHFNWLFPEPREAGYVTSYQATTRTMPDGSVEMREVRVQNGQTEERVTVRYPPGSGIPDETTVTTSSESLT